MNITKNRGIKYAQYVLENVSDYYTDNNDIRMSVETFYNCREQGYVLEVRSEKDYSKNICIWVYAQRNSDEPTITWEDAMIPTENANMFTEESYEERTKTFSSVDEASREVINGIKEYFEL